MIDDASLYTLPEIFASSSSSFTTAEEETGETFSDFMLSLDFSDFAGLQSAF